MSCHLPLEVLRKQLLHVQVAVTGHEPETRGGREDKDQPVGSHFRSGCFFLRYKIVFVSQMGLSDTNKNDYKWFVASYGLNRL